MTKNSTNLSWATGKTIKTLSVIENDGQPVSSCFLFEDGSSLRFDPLDAKRLFISPNGPSSPTPPQDGPTVTTPQQRRSVQRMIRRSQGNSRDILIISQFITDDSTSSEEHSIIPVSFVLEALNHPNTDITVSSFQQPQ